MLVAQIMRPSQVQGQRDDDTWFPGQGMGYGRDQHRGLQAAHERCASSLLQQLHVHRAEGHQYRSITGEEAARHRLRQGILASKNRRADQKPDRGIGGRVGPPPRVSFAVQAQSVHYEPERVLDILQIGPDVGKLGAERTVVRLEGLYAFR